MIDVLTNGQAEIVNKKPEKEQAAERVSHALEDDKTEHEVDPADAERVADATSSPQPEPDEKHSGERWSSAARDENG